LAAVLGSRALCVWNFAHSAYRLAADLNQIGSARAAARAHVVAQSAHLLSPADPAEAVEAVLLSRLHDDPTWRAVVIAFQAGRGRAALVGRWPLTVSKDDTARVWERATGRCVTMMRVEGALNGCGWSPAGNGVIMAGAIGVYGFTFRF
jgi:hypothetical protein